MLFVFIGIITNNLLVIIMILFEGLMRVMYSVRGMHQIFYDFVKSINARYTREIRVVYFA